MTEASRTFKPTTKMASAARRGLRLRERFGRGGTEVGLHRAWQLAAGDSLSATEVKAMYSYFARHAVDKDAAGDGWNTDREPSAGFIAWLLWGGDAGRAWAGRQRKTLD
ncbi:hypothetical protein GGQ88_003801 [Novosphingobium hassiacum]|uniref:Uncharacterized protein n=1 Tax=Novosphingobium hassiacum TaxID=173676 RepID=A0A7W6A3B1_9SPHN|nr:hypothetical protein [Novosphingobium hassiacum]MBB3862500.1 hypothetical protein [Novosphingobium hassiacum]